MEKLRHREYRGVVQSQDVGKVGESETWAPISKEAYEWDNRVTIYPGI